MVECATGISSNELRAPSRQSPLMLLLAILVAESLLIGVPADNALAAPLPPVIDSVSAEEVPLFSPEEAWQLAHEPQSRMIDDVTCERISGVYFPDSEEPRKVLAGWPIGLFRSRRLGTPFLRVRTREDGVYVVRFPARPNEVITGRSYRLDPRTKRFVHGEPYDSVCLSGDVKVGELSPISEEQ